MTEVVLCSCCKAHLTGTNARADENVVACPECGEPCQCEGCVAEVEFSPTEDE